ncbi:hypothetical protein N0V95_004460, partial [Ascochyta clinopodiicola]
MAPYLNDTTTLDTPGDTHEAYLKAPDFQKFDRPPRVLVIGAGSRGTAYAEAILEGTNAIISAVCEPIASKRAAFGRKFIWADNTPARDGQQFANWKQWVEGNWRRESTSAPSLLTKSCHDIDFLMWMLCSPSLNSTTPHLPSLITSTGSLKYFRKSRKPHEAGNATTCLSCAHEPSCAYSAKKIYHDKHLARGITDWPVKIVNPDIEDLYNTSGPSAAASQLLSTLAEDYDASTPEET